MYLEILRKYLIMVYKSCSLAFAAYNEMMSKLTNLNALRESLERFNPFAVNLAVFVKFNNESRGHSQTVDLEPQLS